MKPMPACFGKLALSLAERSVYSVIICAFLISSAFAQSDATFVNANQEYAQSHFQEAIDGYSQLVRSGQWSTNLFYDLGNAYFRAGDFGHAILNYERALALDRHHPEADANLRIVRDEARALELTAPLVERYLKFANVNQFTIAAAIALWVAAFCIVALIFARRRSGVAIALSIVALSIFAGAVFAIYELDNGSHGRALAIVTGTNVQARVATADNANSVLALPPGSEIRVLSNRGDWIYAALPNSLRGWVPAKSAEAVRL
jgi:tetratricopeptide (TPR) repeat protein